MTLVKHDMKEFFEIVDLQTFQNEDIIEAKEFGYESVQDAFKEAELAWARFWTIEDNGTVVACILVQRDGNTSFFVTNKLKGRSVRKVIRILEELSDQIVECCGVLYIRVAGWYKKGLQMLKLSGFSPYVLEHRFQIWIKEDGN